MRAIYEADDGTQFSDKFECIHYEWKIYHPHLKEILFFDKDNNLITEDIFSEKHYNKVYKIIIPSTNAIKDFHDYASYTGFCDYETIHQSGTWSWDLASGFKLED